jgi:hypothetical protein
MKFEKEFVKYMNETKSLLHSDCWSACNAAWEKRLKSEKKIAQKYHGEMAKYVLIFIDQLLSEEKQ